MKLATARLIHVAWCTWSAGNCIVAIGFGVAELSWGRAWEGWLWLLVTSFLAFDLIRQWRRWRAAR